MKILAIETATEACSAALLIDQELIQRHALKPRGHSELVLGMMDDLLSEAGVRVHSLDALAFGRGPGSFTGVRIATGVIQGAALGADLPVLPVSTLAALAQRGYRELAQEQLLPAYDARMGELYWAAYRVGQRGLVELALPEQVASAEQVTLPEQEGWFGVGSGWGCCAEPLQARLGNRLLGFQADFHCSAEDVVRLAAEDFRLGRAVAPERALPVYLRNRVAQKPGSSSK
ncbi:MAG: tRNA (adenosine(37)-N6)-threonylcarbamoyltransferase complex dimerization subunit type 1 TsaB [Candidatus Thiodiazotropha sp.]|jgi:tRNA threonylcarbamoyladenosine biosynthesis protein TsaB